MPNIFLSIHYYSVTHISMYRNLFFAIRICDNLTSDGIHILERNNNDGSYPEDNLRKTRKLNYAEFYIDVVSNVYIAYKLRKRDKLCFYHNPPIFYCEDRLSSV
ncbi:uncharacterized protein LOC143203866 [Rhynchophorus ferrugineus]|uniref:uncharacterized protein LOC143203866 n=1 Tax=Rhynchophorus ferrugineus TaxID=354439 RepID=UPI003FCD03F5